jgi:hypothetical protein
LNLQIIAPAHLPNWDLVSDLVSNGFTRHYRTPSECKKRFESVILKREELCLTEIQSKKQQQQQLAQQQAALSDSNTNTPAKAKGQNKLSSSKPLNICKTKTLRTNQLCIQDNYSTLLNNIKHRFEKINSISKKRSSPTFSYIPITSMKQQNYPESFLSKFGTTPPGPSNTTSYSQIVLNAISAVTAAHRQNPNSSVIQQQQQKQQMFISPETVTFKTPKYLSELKLQKEKQQKMAVASAAAAAAATVATSSLTPSKTATITTTPSIVANQIPIQQQQPQSAQPQPFQLGQNPQQQVNTYIQVYSTI